METLKDTLMALTPNSVSCCVHSRQASKLALFHSVVFIFPPCTVIWRLYLGRPTWGLAFIDQFSLTRSSLQTKLSTVNL